METEKIRRFYVVRWARENEWAPAMKMIWKTFLKFEGRDYTQEGIKNFFDFITDDDLYVAFLKGTYRMMVALDGEKVIGAGSIRNRNHLSLLFVDEDYHHMGVGSALLTGLCDYLKREAGECCMSLKAAPYAVDFYMKQGFKTVKPEEEYSGIRVTAMEKVLV
ncbi:MAG: GNAT family N-acetyltransferase [Acetatifactor sp.]|nr:GNAT family N-acetyltransferase [Acetatifactor sp.]